MIIKTTIHIGNSPFAIEGELKGGLKGFIEGMSLFADLPKQCPFCKSADLWPQYRTPKTFKYYSIKCNGCSAEFKFGEKRDGSGLYPKGWEKASAHNGVEENTDLSFPPSAAPFE